MCGDDEQTGVIHEEREREWGKSNDWLNKWICVCVSGVAYKMLLTGPSRQREKEKEREKGTSDKNEGH